MPTLRKSPRKTKKKPDYYGGNRGDDDDSGNRGDSLIPGQKNVSEPSVKKKKKKVGYKKSRHESQTPSRTKSSDVLLALSESEYEEKSESESERDDERRERSRASKSLGGRNKKTPEYAKGTPSADEGRRVVGTRNSGYEQQGPNGTPSSNEDRRVVGTRKSGNQEQQGRQNTHRSVNAGGGLDDDSRECANDSPSSTDEDGHEVGSRTRHINKGLQKRMFEREEQDQDEESDSEDREGLKRQMRYMERTISELKRKNDALESRLARETRMSRSDKSTWSGQEMNFVKDVNDFCKEKLFPREKFLRKNWQEYLPRDRRSFYSLCMDHLSIPEGSDPKEIWGRVVVPAVRDKYQSMKCNLNNKIKSVYLGMKI